MSKDSLTPRRRFELALQGINPGAVPFVIWHNKIPEAEFEHELINAEACIVIKSDLYTTHLKTINIERKSWIAENGHKMDKTVYHTKYGELEETFTFFDGIRRSVSHIFKSPDDYNAILCLLNDYAYSASYDRFLQDDAKYGEYGIARPITETSPFFQLMYDIMGIMNFSIEWLENKDKVLELYEALCTIRKKRLEIISCSPAKYCVIDGNIEMSTVGKERLEMYYIPSIREGCDILESKGIVSALHLDGYNRMLLDPVAMLKVGVIESFTPPPDCDVTVEEGLKVWPGKTLMVNFPSSLHQEQAKEIDEYALSILEQLRGSGRAMLGVIENVPRNDYIIRLAHITAENG